jgi:spore coat protein W
VEDLNGKLNQLSKDLVGLHVMNVFNKNGDKKVRTLSDEEKDRIKNLVKNLQEQVDEFVNKTKEAANKVEEAAPKKTRTTLRDSLKNRKQK